MGLSVLFRIFATKKKLNMAKMWPQRNALYHNKYVGSCIRIALKIITFLADNAALCVIVGAILEFGFVLTEKLQNELNLVYFWAWNMFLIERISHLLLTKRGHRKSAYNLMGWILNSLLGLTLIPIFVEFFNIDDSIGVMSILDNRGFHLFILFIISFIELSDAVITSLGRKTNPALMLAVSFLFIILVGSGVLLMPRCIQPGVHLSWIDSLFTTNDDRRAQHVYGVRTTGDYGPHPGGRSGHYDHHKFLRPLLHG